MICKEQGTGDQGTREQDSRADRWNPTHDAMQPRHEWGTPDSVVDGASGALMRLRIGKILSEINQFVLGGLFAVDLCSVRDSGSTSGQVLSVHYGPEGDFCIERKEPWLGDGWDLRCVFHVEDN